MMLKNFGPAGFRPFPAIVAAIALVPSLVVASGAIAMEQILSLAPEQLPRSVMGTAGGRTAIPGAIVPGGQGSPSCLGFASPSPDHQFQLDDAPGQLTLTVDSFDPAIDTTLVVQTPDGRWLCGDDISDTDTDATITINGPATGHYQVWVGTFDGGYGDYELRLH